MEYLLATMSKQEWLDKVFSKSKSKSSRISASSAIKKLEEFCLKEYKKEADTVLKDLRNEPIEKAYRFLDKYVTHLGDLSPKTVRTYFGWVRTYLRKCYGIKTHLEEIEEEVTLPTQEKQERTSLTPEIIKTLCDNSKEDRKGLYMTLVSSGMRVGEALSLRKREFEFDKDPVTVKIFAKNSKTRRSRTVFVSSECKDMILKLVKRKGQDDLVFTDQQDNAQAVRNEERVFQRLRQRCGYMEKYPDGKRFIVNIHAFRSYCYTKAVQVHGEQYAHALLGHGSYLDQYYRLTEEEKGEKYKELEPQLLIYGSSEITKTQKELVQKVENQENEIQRNQTNMKTMIDEVVFLRGMVEEIAYNLNRKEDEANNVSSEPKEQAYKKIKEYEKRLKEKLQKSFIEES